MNEYSHLVDSRARHRELVQQANCARLANALRHRRSFSAPMHVVAGMLTLLVGVLPWLRRG